MEIRAACAVKCLALGDVAATPCCHYVVMLLLLSQVYSNGLVTSLAVPDFSMPYNVVCLTSTVLAVFLGAVINSLLQRHGLQERIEAAGPETARALKASKLRKVLAILVLFGALGWYWTRLCRSSCQTS